MELIIKEDGDKTIVALVAAPHKRITVNMSVNEFYKCYHKWQRGEYIQKAFNILSADEREFMISGTTPDEWNKLFPQN